MEILFNARDMIPYFITSDMTRYAKWGVPWKIERKKKKWRYESLKTTPMEVTHSRTRSEN